MRLTLFHLKTFLLAVATSCICSTSHAGVTIPSYSLENARVAAFIKEVTYKSKDETKIKSYNVSPPKRRDQPAPVPLEWKSWKDAASQKLILSNSGRFTTFTEYNLGATDSTYDIYNLVPGRTYYYKVEATSADGKDSTLVSASFATTGQVRMLKGGYNVRDIGGWKTRTGQKIRYEYIYRGAELDGEYALNSADSAALHDAGIRAELDLRGNSEADYVTVSRLGPDVDYKRIPTENYYIDGIKANNPRFTQQLEYIFANVKEGKPVYFHCHIGADRTGCLGFLIEGLLGVSESDIYKEYELTTFSGLDTHRYKSNIEDMMDYIKTFDGATLDEQFFSYCTQGLKLDPAAIMEFKSIMLQYDFVSTIDFGTDTLTINAGETLQLDPTVTPEAADKKTIVYSSDDPLVATVTNAGFLTAVRGDTTVITAKSNVISKKLVVVVPHVESEIPQFVTVEGMDYDIIGPNLISNGSFEYAHSLSDWTSGLGFPLAENGFQVKEDSPWGDRYLQCIYDGDDESTRSIRTIWPIEAGKSYVIGYRVKTADGKTVSNNSNMRVGLINTGSSAFNGDGDDFIWDADDAPSPSFNGQTTMVNGQPIVAAEEPFVFPFPTYGRDWADIHYVFTNTDNYTHCQVWFSHLGKNGTYTCLDNFYLAEIGEGKPTAVKDIKDKSSILKGQCYDLQGRKTSKAKGIYIQNGKTYKAH